jgi:rare lipoprotein A
MSLRYLAIAGACALFAACAPIQPEHAASHTIGTVVQDAVAAPTIASTPAPDSAVAPEPDDASPEPAVIDFQTIDAAAQSGHASWYASKFEGRRTANGERYDGNALTAAHRTLPMGSYVRVTSLATSRSVVVRINDRGPFVKGRIIDLSYAAASSLGLTRAASMQVQIERVRKTDVQTASNG